MDYHLVNLCHSKSSIHITRKQKKSLMENNTLVNWKERPHTRQYLFLMNTTGASQFCPDILYMEPRWRQKEKLCLIISLVEIERKIQTMRYMIVETQDTQFNCTMNSSISAKYLRTIKCFFRKWESRQSEKDATHLLNELIECKIWDLTEYDEIKQQIQHGVPKSSAFEFIHPKMKRQTRKA